MKAAIMNREGRKPRFNAGRGVAGAIAASLMLGACAGTSAGGSGAGDGEFSLSYMNGIGYAPMIVAKAEGWLEEELPETEVTWTKLGSGAATRDGMIADEIDAGTLGVPPYLVGLSQGMDWKILVSMADMNFKLVTMRDDLRELEDFDAGDRIATVAPDSIHAVALRKNALDKLGDAKALDKNLTALPHPDALQALMGGQIAAYYGSVPFQNLALDDGAHVIADSSEAFGSTNFAAVVMKSGFYDNNPELAEALFSAVERAIELIQDDPERAAEILASEDPETGKDEYLGQLQDDAVTFDPKVNGALELAQFMEEQGIISEAPASEEEIMFEEVHDLS